MDLVEAIERRRSTRQFLPDPIPEADVEEMVRLAQLAPSGSNQQMWRFIAVTNRGVLKQMQEAVLGRYDRMIEKLERGPDKAAARAARAYSSFFADAPVTIAVVVGPYQSGLDGAFTALGVPVEKLRERRGYPEIQSIGAAIEHLLLAATSLGYGGCWVVGCLAARPELEPLLGIQAPEQLIALVPIGRPAAQPAPRAPRREGSGLSWVR